MPAVFDLQPPAETELIDKSGLALLLGVSVDTHTRRLDQLPPPYRVGRKLIWVRELVIEHIRAANAAGETPAEVTP